MCIRDRVAQLTVSIRAENRPASAPPPMSPAGIELESAAAQFDNAVLTARRLMDDCEVEHAPGGGLTVVMRKDLPAGQRIDAAGLARLGAELAASPVQNTYSEMQQQNRELGAALAELRERQDDLLALTRELEDTNRGVVALYADCLLYTSPSPRD